MTVKNNRVNPNKNACNPFLNEVRLERLGRVNPKFRKNAPVLRNACSTCSSWIYGEVKHMLAGFVFFHKFHKHLVDFRKIK